MNMKIKIEYTFNSIKDLLAFLNKTGRIDGEIEVEEEKVEKVEKEFTIKDALKELCPDAITNASDDE